MEGLGVVTVTSSTSSFSSSLSPSSAELSSEVSELSGDFSSSLVASNRTMKGLCTVPALPQYTSDCPVDP